ncbi:MAG: agmatine deiminase family protein [Leptospirales bacterium]|nr:agmatine deiminase family protein [Leptospirales bacterium]
MIDITNYSMPAEWEEHQRTFVEWPVKSSMLYPENHETVCAGYAEVVNAICEFEPVTVIINNDSLEEARRLCSSQAELLEIPHDDAWIRDNGPTFVRSTENEIAGIDWRFNAWGEKHPDFHLDDMVAERLLEILGIPMYSSNMTLEGGAIHSDGEGVLLATEQSLLNKNRNPYHTRTDIENELKKCLGIKRIIWLSKGLSGDETDGHIDNTACFAPASKILLQVCHDMNDFNYNITIENRNIFKRENDAAMRKFDIIEIEQPPLVKYKGKRLTLSYVNFYIVNGGIIMPFFDVPKTDEAAAAVLREMFPERKIITLDGMNIVTEGGGIHCITQQMPKGSNTK